MLRVAFGAGRRIDLELGAEGLVTGRDVRDWLTTAAVISLFSDRRAEPSDELPQPGGLGPFGGDRRGWVGDLLADERLGSRLWLLSRAKQTETTRRLAEDYAREALDWLVRDGHALACTVEAQWASMGVLALRVVFDRPAGAVVMDLETDLGAA